MADILEVANYIYNYYNDNFIDSIGELKLQKLIYLCQREKLAIVNEPMFSENLEGWKHGPVSPDVRSWYKEGCIDFNYNLSEEDAYIIRNVIDQYGSLDSWSLRDLTHRETSWEKSREGLDINERGNRDILLEDIKIDALRIRPFDNVWGMYYDEFEDFEEVECL